MSKSRWSLRVDMAHACQRSTSNLYDTMDHACITQSHTRRHRTAWNRSRMCETTSHDTEPCRGDGEDRTVEEAPPDPTRPETPLVLFATSRHCPSTRRRCSSPLVVKIVAVLGLQGPDER
ncbi:hypothetical protein GW17_00042160 [Ensete ventricosum]|nr:hypothetical protein GW17_00042160 [Ensete ventricosum]